MTFDEQVASRLRAIRHVQKVHQDVIARALDYSVSGVSRLERGQRNLRVDQIVRWVAALGHRVELVFWMPALPEDQWAPDDPERAGLDDACAAVLAEVASALPHVPEPARKALIQEMELWKQHAGSI